MSMVVWGGPAPKGEAAWEGSDDPGAGIYLQACNVPLAALLSSTADGTQGTMQYKAIPILNWAGCVCALLMWWRCRGCDGMGWDAIGLDGSP